MLVDYLLTLKQAYQRDRFNEIVDKINFMKGKEMLGRIPRLPERIDAFKVLKRSLLLANRYYTHLDTILTVLIYVLV